MTMIYLMHQHKPVTIFNIWREKFLAIPLTALIWHQVFISNCQNLSNFWIENNLLTWETPGPCDILTRIFVATQYNIGIEKQYHCTKSVLKTSETMK